MSEIDICNQEIWHYCVLPEICYDVDIGEYHTYGITVTSPNYTKTIHDISIYEETVVQMVNLFVKYQLSPIHFQDAVEDMLCEC